MCDEDQVVQPLLALEKDWDSYGGERITAEAIHVVRNGAVVPRTDGGVTFEWHINGWDVELDFGPDGVPVCYWQERT